MSDTDTTSETVNTGDTQTEATTTTTQNTGNDSAAEVERLRKEAEQAKMRANQLEKEADARRKADEEAEAKRLEENNEYKTLLEQERTKREALEQEAEEREAKAELSKAKAEALKDFPEEVQKQAEDLGIDLARAGEDEVKAYVEKLTKLNDSFGNNGGVKPNNGQVRNPKYDQHEVLQAHANGDKDAMNQYLNHIPWIAENMKDRQ